MSERGYFHPDVYTSGLQVLTDDADRLYVCNALPTTYTEATATFALGVKLAPTVNAPAARTGGGYEVEVDTFIDGTVATEGSATHWCLVDTVGLRLLSVKKLAAAQTVYEDNLFGLAKEGGGDLAIGFLPPPVEV